MLELIKTLGFTPKENTMGFFEKKYTSFDDYSITYDAEKKSIDFGGKISFNRTENSTQKFTKPEDMVVLECVDRLLEKGYAPDNIILEKVYPSGHGTSGRLDILVTQDSEAYMMIECKTWGKEFDKEFSHLQKNGGQLFTYFQQDKNAEILVLYTSNLDGETVVYKNEIVKIEKEYRDTSNVKDFYDRWNKLTKNNGVFEKDASAYAFVSKALTKKELQALKQEDSNFIFNRFLEILRHNVVSDKPNAFNKIFTLFLCKIIDEDRSDDEQLHFQWLEGEDTHVSFQKRLSDLYTRGMNELLEKKVTDVSDSEFDKQFQQVDDKYKAKFKEMLTEMRLKKNNEFAIKEVYDDDSFNENAVVVKEIVELLQTYQIRYNYRQQFLSDFFELLLTTGLKQESGQFFTPVPLARFIIKSMPITQIVEEKVSRGDKTDLLPAVIDYAAGSGHFITESMEEIQKYIDTMDESRLTPTSKRAIKSWKADPFDWAEDYVYGIEKDYRLVKTAKVSCYLHGDGLAKVIHGDGLADFATAKEYRDRLKTVDKTYTQDNKAFDVVISNPPYSVSSFKSMMDSTKAKENFTLFDRLTDQSSEIEALFIERTKQLLKDGGMAGIILPSSILSNTGIYTQAREIILNYFDIVGIVELGSNTFMATGTNTVILFLRRKNNADHLNTKASVEKLFTHKQDIAINGIENPLQKYLAHVWEDMSIDDYFTLLNDAPSDKLLDYEVMKEYIHNFKDDKGDISERLARIVEIEKEKLLYFVMAYPQKVTVVKTGDKKAEKKFLGYEFSHRRGNEGIHPTQRGKTIDECTTLYDESSYTNKLKANSYIYSAFNGDFKEIDESLKHNVSYVNLIDMMNFDSVNFEKNISLSIEKKVNISFLENCDKYTKEKISSFAVLNPSKKEISDLDDNTIVSFIEMSSVSNDGFIQEKIERPLHELRKGSFTYFKEDDIIIAKITPSMENGKCAIAKGLTNGLALGSSEFHVIRVNTSVSNKYLFAILNTQEVRIEAEHKMVGASGHRRVPINFYGDLKIPLPPKKIQEKIVDEIETLEEQVKSKKGKIESLRNNISEKIASVKGSLVSLQEMTTKIGSGSTPRGGESAYKLSGISLIRSQNIYDEGMRAKGLVYIDDIQAQKLDNVTVEKDDILFNITGASVARCCMVEEAYLPARVNQHVSIIRTNNKALSKYVQIILTNSEYKNKLLEIASGGTSREAITKTQLETFKIPLPSMEEQKKIVSKIEAIEKQIKQKEKELVSIPQRKEDVLKQYL